MKRSFLAAGAAMAVAAGLLAGCGSSSGGSQASGSSGSDKTPSGTPIKIGVIGSYSGAQASSSDQGKTVAPAWADYVNKDLGGIAGHPVQIVDVDDKGDPVSAQAAGKQLVNAGVVAIIAGSDNLLPAFDGEAIAAKIPVISGTANSTDWYTKVGLFPTPTDVASGLADQVLVAKQFGKATKFADLYCSEVAACGQANDPLKAAAEKAGIGFTSLAVSSTASSYTAQCLTLQQQKVDYAQLNFTTAAAVKFVQDCQAQGYNPTWGTSAQSIGADYLKLSDFTAYGPAYVFPSVGDAPAVKTFTDAMTKYASDGNWKEGTASFTWSGLEALRKALATATPGSAITSATVTAGLNTFSGEDLGGLLANKITFTAGKPTAFGSHPCAFVIGVKGGKTIAPNGMNPVCPSA